MCEGSGKEANFWRRCWVVNSVIGFARNDPLSYGAHFFLFFSRSRNRLTFSRGSIACVAEGIVRKMRERGRGAPPSGPAAAASRSNVGRARSNRPVSSICRARLVIVNLRQITDGYDSIVFCKRARAHVFRSRADRRQNRLR